MPLPVSSPREDETPDCRANLAGIHAGLIDEVEALAAEEGQPVEEVQRGIEEMNATTAFMSRRFLMIAEAV